MLSYVACTYIKCVFTLLNNNENVKKKSMYCNIVLVKICNILKINTCVVHVPLYKGTITKYPYKYFPPVVLYTVLSAVLNVNNTKALSCQHYKIIHNQPQISLHPHFPPL